MLTAIIFDAFFSDSQAYCKSTYNPTLNHMFLSSNLYGFALIFTFSILSGELIRSITFCMKHPTAFRDVLLIALLQIVNQKAIYYVVSNFKQHIYPLISTVRRLFSILASIYIFKHTLLGIQWVSICIVFVAMGY